MRITTDFAVRVLVVDDDPLVLKVLGVVLAASGFACRTAEDGYEAVRILLETSFDVVVSDLRMPKLSGFELLGIIRQCFPETAVIVISSEVDPVSQISSSLMDAFFQKGTFTHEQLVTVIRKLAKQYRNLPTRGTKRPSRIVRPDGQQIEIDSRQIEKDREEEPARKGQRFTIQDEECAGFRVRGLYDPWEQAWRIKTWATAGDKPEHDLWVRDKDLHTIKAATPTNDNGCWRRSCIGDKDVMTGPVEKKAVLSLVSKWEANAQRSA